MSVSKEKRVQGTMNRQVKFVGTAVGIFVCYFYYGILQESITKGKYFLEDGTKEPFTFTLSLVAVQCIVNYFYAIIILAFFTPLKPTCGKVSKKLYATCALTYLLAMVTSNMSLRWVSYPTQVIGKSCKPIPVMILGVLVGGRSYALKKYMFVLVIVAGVALFMYNPNKAAATEAATATAGGLGIGELMLLMSLSMDGLTGAVQERMRGESNSKPNSAHMMKMINLFSVGYTLVGIVFTGELVNFAQFIQRHPFIVYEMVTFSIASALGQFFIFVMVSEFGPLPCSIVTTTRKFFTVLASVIFFGNVLTGLQWLGASAVFAGLALDSVYGGK